MIIFNDVWEVLKAKYQEETSAHDKNCDKQKEEGVEPALDSLIDLANYYMLFFDYQVLSQPLIFNLFDTPFELSCQYDI
jgi:hypothetical protein